MLQVDQEVLLMSAPGRFRVVAVDGDVLTIENQGGLRKRVLSGAVRWLQARPNGQAST